MPELPKPKRLSLSDAVAYIIKNFGPSKVYDEILVAFHGALSDGALTATGKLVTFENFYPENEEDIPTKVWQQFHGSKQFREWIEKTYIPANIIENLKRGKDIDDPPFYFHPTLTTADIDKWLNISLPKKAVSKAPKPLSAARGGYTPPEEYYSVPVKENDYRRCITGGNIKIHHLAALAHDLSPPSNTGDNTAQSHLYLKDMRGSDTEFGIACNKLVQAVQTNLLPIISNGHGAGDQWVLISLSEGIKFLENEGIHVSSKLKGNVGYVQKGKPGNRQKDDSVALKALQETGLLFPDAIEKIWPRFKENEQSKEAFRERLRNKSKIAS